MRLPIALLVLAGCAARGETGSKSCAGCHTDIFRTYQQTGMARSSGVVAQIDDEGEFAHKPSGVRFRMYRDRDNVFFDFDLPGVRGRRRLEYFIGSGAVGRSYLYSIDGFLYEAPVSWYSNRAAWGPSPGYESHRHLYLTRAVVPGCLQCHASRLQPTSGTQNGYGSPPFLEDGVSCERCHGSGDAHVRGRAKMVNPAILAPDRRDSICAQCHLSGETRVVRAGRRGSFRPGDRLSEYEITFVWSSDNVAMKVRSHFEKFAQSECKKASGDRFWCGTCHDPHRAPADAEKTAYYRGICLQCHEPGHCNRGLDCAGCHMPKNPVRDVDHVVYTNHAIRKPGTRAAAVKGERKLVPFGGAWAEDREFGLAYAAIPGFEGRAIKYLERAPQDDAQVLAQLAFLYDSMGREGKAIPLYEKALEIDPVQVVAAVNLGSAFMRRGQAAAAMRLWRDALQRNPGLETARLNLAVAQFRTGDVQSAEASLMKLLELNPGATIPRRLLSQMQSRH